MTRFTFPGEAYDVTLTYERAKDRQMSLQGLLDDYDALFPATERTQAQRHERMYKAAAEQVAVLVRFLLDTAHQPLSEGLSLYVEFSFMGLVLREGFTIGWVMYELSNGHPVIVVYISDYYANGANSPKRAWAAMKKESLKLKQLKVLID